MFTEITVRIVAAVWLVHGLYNKLLGGSARHLAIVQSVPGLGGAAGERVLTAVGIGEVAIALWVLSGWRPRLCAATQTVALLSMNAMELTFARPLLIWPAGLLPLNVAFLGLAWAAADAQAPLWLRARLRRHPIPIQAHFHNCLTLTYALPADVLRPLLSPGLELDTAGGYGFVAVALVQAESLRPAGLPRALGQDFFLAGYRVFTTFRAPNGRRLRGLRILRSDANRARMVAGGNLLTHYNYHRCASRVETTGRRIRIAVSTPDHGGDLRLTADLSNPVLPAGSPFASMREARRFAGPLPFTFDFEPETDAIIAIQATRANWRPEAVSVEVARLSFFDQPAFEGCTPILAAAFHVAGVDYRWERGVRYPLPAGLLAVVA
ncbi:MAG TPA: DoxX-like family protein [Vicinamibacterales bacterium]